MAGSRAGAGGSANIVLIILDDVGFGDTSPFGGPAQIPALDRLEAEGLRYNRFHTTRICPRVGHFYLGATTTAWGSESSALEGYPGYDGYERKMPHQLPAQRISPTAP